MVLTLHIQVHQTIDPHQKLKSSPAFLRLREAEGQSPRSPSQGRNSAANGQKFAYSKQNKTVSTNTEQAKPNAPHIAAIPKSRTQQKNQ